MNASESKAVMAACVMAAFADGGKDEREREQIRRIAEGLAGSDAGLARAYQDVLLERTTLADIASALVSPESKTLAYEMAVCVCDADGTQNEDEKRFLASLRAALGAPSGPAARFTSKAESIASEPVGGAAPASDAELDQSILNNAILCAALEQLPHSIATLSIIPVQMRMVYRIGARYGFTLDRGHITDFLATAGIGMTSQVVEGFARGLVGGLFGRALGGGFLVRGLAGRATGSAVAFATTYALGHLAKRYYAGGRKLSVDEIKSTFSSLLAQARGIESQHASDIAQKAREVNVADFLPLVRQS
jgi:uncharacterized protein (DUF697 family)/tellurite resistance protein